MAGDDAHLIAAHTLIELKRWHDTRAENEKKSEGKCDKGTTVKKSAFNRRILRDRSNTINCLIKIASEVTDEAERALSQCDAIGKIMKYRCTLGEYPACYVGLKKCHYRALYAVSPKAAKLAYSKQLKHHEESKILECLQQYPGPKNGKVFRLRRSHWVSINPCFLTDDANCWPVVNFKVACAVLDLLQSKDKKCIFCLRL